MCQEIFFGWTFSFSNCHIIGLDTSSLVFIVFGWVLSSIGGGGKVMKKNRFSNQLHPRALSPTNLWFEQTKFDCCGRKIDRRAEVKYWSSKKHLSCRFNGHFFRSSKDVLLSFEAKSTPVLTAQSKSSLRSFLNWAFVLTTTVCRTVRHYG
jgi:hypothetical protein